MHESIIFAAQAALQKAGYYRAALDGIWGDMSHDAMDRFQKRAGASGLYGEREIAELAQRHLHAQGLYNGTFRGRPGPKTLAAAIEYMSRRTGQLIPNTGRSAFVDAMISAAQGELAVRETSRNRGPGIEKYWTETTYPGGYKNREPWCAAFVSWIVAVASRKAFEVTPPFTLPRTPLAFGFESWQRGNAGIVSRVPQASARPGDIVVFSFSHVGLVVSNDRGTLTTIEGNTDGAGSREGNGVYRKTRRTGIRSIIRINA